MFRMATSRRALGPRTSTARELPANGLHTSPRAGARRPPLGAAAAVAALLLALSPSRGAGTTPEAPPLPPQPAVRAVGTQAGLGDVVVVGHGAKLEAVAGDAAVVAHILDGSEAEAEAWSTGWEPGAHEAAVAVAGLDGAPQALPPLRFVYDPEPPTLQWEVGGTELLDAYGLDQDVERRAPPRRTVPARDRAVDALWSPDGRRWLPLLPRDAEPDGSGALADWLVAADRPQVFLWALEEGVFGYGAPLAPKRRQLVRVWGADSLSAVREMRLRVLPAAGGGYSLELVATDLVGNRMTTSWPLGR